MIAHTGTTTMNSMVKLDDDEMFMMVGRPDEDGQIVLSPIRVDEGTYERIVTSLGRPVKPTEAMVELMRG